MVAIVVLHCVMTSRRDRSPHDSGFFPFVSRSSFQHCQRRLGPFLRFQAVCVFGMHGDAFDTCAWPLGFSTIAVFLDAADFYGAGGCRKMRLSSEGAMTEFGHFKQSKTHLIRFIERCKALVSCIPLAPDTDLPLPYLSS